MSSRVAAFLSHCLPPSICFALSDRVRKGPCFTCSEGLDKINQNWGTEIYEDSSHLLTVYSRVL
jgi:hypothetical protein